MQRAPVIYFSDLHTLKEECYQDYYSLILCLKGKGRLDYHGLDITIEKDSMLIIHHLSELDIRYLSKGISISGLMIKQSHLSSLVPNDNFGAHNAPRVYNNPKVLLNRADANDVADSIEYVHKRLINTDMHFYNEIITALTIGLVLEVYEFYNRYLGFVKDISNRRLGIYQQFIDILNQGQARTHRSVAYYAEQLCITPKHLSVIVKQLTGSTASDIINQYALQIIRKNLEDNELSISQIAELMHFESVSYFCRYTKKLLGVTPNYYRTALIKEKRKIVK